MAEEEKQEADVKEFVVVAMVRDLIFSSKIRSTAEAVGTSLLMVDSAGVLRSALAANPVQLLIVDLSMSSHDAIQSIAVAKACVPKPKIVAYVAHVQPELAQMAKQAGADDVMPRSKFSVELPNILAEYAEQDA